MRYLRSRERGQVHRLTLCAFCPDSLPRITRQNRIGCQRVHVHLGMTDQRDSLPDRLGPAQFGSLVPLRMQFAHHAGRAYTSQFEAA